MTGTDEQGPVATRGAATEKPYPKRCDLVLKGGITSGVVYPGAIVSLSKHYRFRQIGGTSAGAIAAAAAAAAELGRNSGKRPNAFASLAQLPRALGAIRPDGKSALFSKFQPTARAARLFDTLTAAAGGGKTAVLRVLAKALARYRVAALLGALPALLAAIVSPPSPLAFGAALQFTLFGTGLIVGVVIALLCALLRDAGRVLPEQGWGMCAGVRRDARGNEDPAALSTWLHGYLNDLAGLPADDVLTFGHLWRGDGTPAQGDIKPVNRVISFKAMTTALNLERPLIVPFETTDGSDIFFREADLLDVLPSRVVAHMVSTSRARSAAQAGKMKPETKAILAQGYLRLPYAWDLPVLLAVRMSLSFPVLLSAIRLYKPDRSRKNAADLMQPLWFSDGGICSNLPVHLFDSPVPTHPTFTINLSEPPQDFDGESAEPSAEVRVPDNAHSGKEGYRSYFHQTTGLPGIVSFVMAVVDSARNWVDSGQMRLQGYRERVGTVFVHPNEGGLNLSMPATAIDALSARGTLVAEKLHAAFSQNVWLGRNGWDRHQWIRLRNHLGALATQFVDVETALRSMNLSISDLQIMVAQHPGTNTAQDRDQAQQAALIAFLAALSKVIDDPALRAVKDKSGGQLRLRPR